MEQAQETKKSKLKPNRKQRRVLEVLRRTLDRGQKLNPHQQKWLEWMESENFDIT
jgi:hypothetical protein